MNALPQVDFAKTVKSFSRRPFWFSTLVNILKRMVKPNGLWAKWASIKNIRGKKLDYLKVNGFKKKYDGPGFSFWNPSKNITQDMDGHAGALPIVNIK